MTGLYLRLQILAAALSLQAAQYLDVKRQDMTMLTLIIEEGLACFDMAAAISGLGSLNGVCLNVLYISSSTAHLLILWIKVYTTA